MARAVAYRVSIVFIKVPFGLAIGCRFLRLPYQQKVLFVQLAHHSPRSGISRKPLHVSELQHAGWLITAHEHRWSRVDRIATDLRNPASAPMMPRFIGCGPKDGHLYIISLNHDRRTYMCQIDDRDSQ
jgi:hypothetical protein